MKKILTLLIISFLCVTWSFAQDCTIGTTVGSMCTFNTTGTLTIPATHNLTIEVQAWGAGGGSLAPNNGTRSGGGGGAYFNPTYTVSAGESFVITVGQGIVGHGGNTSFDIDGGGDEVIQGGLRGSADPGAGGTGPAGSVTGGAGGTRESANGGGGGGGGSGPGNGDGVDGTTAGVGGAGGAAGSPGGAGGAGGDTNELGEAGGFPGGGAGGKGRNSPSPNVGAAGGNGQVIVTVTASVLPVELVRFNANVKKNYISLEWQTASEQNNKGFEIQKSKDGLAWNILEFVEGKGTSDVFNTYASVDKLPTPGANYYRLKQLDFDGEFAYSKIVLVDFNQLNEVGMFPNPVKSELTLTNAEGNATIYNVLGQPVKQLTINANQATIQLSDLLNGQYYLQVRQVDETIVTKQFSKVN